MMMSILHNQLEAQENLFNWGKYAFNKFIGRVREFELKIVNNLAETKVNMHYGLKIATFWKRWA